MSAVILAEIGGHLTIRLFSHEDGDGFGLTRTDYSDDTQVAVIFDGSDRGTGEAEGYAQLFARAPSMLRLLRRALAEHGDAFDADEQVPGADLVEWFASWRLEVRELLTLPLPTTPTVSEPDA